VNQKFRSQKNLGEEENNFVELSGIIGNKRDGDGEENAKLVE